MLYTTIHPSHIHSHSLGGYATLLLQLSRDTLTEARLANTGGTGPSEHHQ